MDSGPFSDVIEDVARALDTAPRAAFWAPLEYPWSVQNFEATPRAERPRPSADRVDLYVHVPFCRYRCSFCIYAVRPLSTRAEMARYVSVLDHELERVASGAAIHKVIVGGGTPTALPPDLFDEALGRVLARVEHRPDGGHKVEASPDSLEDGHLTALEKHGIGWVSVGVETLDDGVLGTVHRQHSPEQALAACRKVVGRGFRLNADLIYGLPGQTEESFGRDLERLAETGVHRVCLYALRLNENVRAASQLAPEERFDLLRLMRWRSFVTRTARELGFEPKSYYAFERVDDASPRVRAVVGMQVDGPTYGIESQGGDNQFLHRFALRTHEGYDPAAAMRFALDDKWRLAVLAICAAGILDGLDGRIARVLKGATRFGAELDSLSDFLCF